MLCKEHIVGLHTNPIPFSCLGLILVAIGPFGFSIFTSLNDIKTTNKSILLGNWGGSNLFGLKELL